MGTGVNKTTYRRYTTLKFGLYACNALIAVSSKVNHKFFCQLWPIVQQIIIGVQCFLLWIENINNLLFKAIEIFSLILRRTSKLDGMLVHLAIF